MSTPIENNTEELQEILQTVNNLPNLGGNNYDWVIVMNLTADKLTAGTLPTQEDVSDVIGDYATVKAKLQNNEKVNVLIKHEFSGTVFGGDMTIKSTTTPVMIGLASGALYGPEAIVADFVFNAIPGMLMNSMLIHIFWDGARIYINSEALTSSTPE